MKRRTNALRGVFAFVVLGSVVMAGAVLAACGVEWFPKCDDPKHPCPPVEPDYPSSPRDAGRDTRDVGVSG